MKKRLSLAGPVRLSAVLCLAGCFAVGALAGCLFAGVLGAEALLHLSDYLQSYFLRMRESGAADLPSFFSTAVELCRWPVLVFVLGFTGLGAVGIPAVFLIRGFLLSYSVAVFVRLFGLCGFAAAGAVFGIGGVFVLPAFFVLGADALESAGALCASFFGQGKRPVLLQRGRLVRAGGCGALLAVGTGVQFWLAPVLVRTAAELLI